MLIRVTRIKFINIYGGGLKIEPDVIINTDLISELQPFYGVSRFLFLEQPADRKGRKRQWYVFQDVEDIRTVMNTFYADNIISLDVFPDNDVTKATYRTHYQIREIVKVYPYAANRNYSWVLMGLGFKLERLLVNNYWLDFLALAKTGSTSTTTSSTSTTSSSSTSTTCTPTTSTSSSTTTTIP